MKLVLPGGSGQVGTLLARAFGAEGHEVVILSRGGSSAPGPSPAPWRVVQWDARNLGPWTAELDGADVVFNLAGRSVDCRYHQRNRRLMIDSRVDSTRVVGAAIARSPRPPKVWLQMSTATIYAHRYDAPNDEATGILGGDEPGVPETWHFSIEVAKAWEQALGEASTPETRKVALRTAMVMSPEPGGVFAVLLRLVRLGLGGRAGDGRQYVSWIHGQDFVRAVRWLIGHEELAGAVNVSSPGPLPWNDFMAALRQAWGTRIALPATRWMLEIGAFLLRTETELVLKSRRVVPGRLTASGFGFDFPAWTEAARDLCERYRQARA